MLRDLLPLEVLECIATTPTLTEQYSADVPGWRWNERRNFKVQVYHINRYGNKVADKLDALGRAQSMAGGDLCHATIVADEKRCWEDHSRAAILPFQCCRRTDPGG
ncbi:hypothetical protein V6N13_033900 [Hibiscus sabdariffa]